MTNEHDVVNDDSLIDRYLNGQMDAAEVTAFEIRMLDEPALLEQVQLIEAMKQGLEEQENSLLSAPVQTAKILPFRGWLRQPLSMAASVLLAVMMLQQFLPGGSSSSTNTPIGTVLLLENSRGAVPVEFSGPPPYLFQVDVGFGNQAESFKLTVHDESDAEVMLMDGLQADTDGWIRLVVGQPLAGNYRTELEWVDGQGAVQNRTFQLQVSQ